MEAAFAGHHAAGRALGAVTTEMAKIAASLKDAQNRSEPTLTAR